MSKNQTIATWVAFMLTAMQNKFGVFGDDFIEIMNKYKIISFLVNNYELLHYYDNDYVIGDVTKYIAKQGGSLHAV
jgi:hypothetical protein